MFCLWTRWVLHTNYLYKMALLFLSIWWQALAVTLHSWGLLIKIINLSCNGSLLKRSMVCSATINNLYLSCWWTLHDIKKCISSSITSVLQIWKNLFFNIHVLTSSSFYYRRSSPTFYWGKTLSNPTGQRLF